MSTTPPAHLPAKQAYLARARELDELHRLRGPFGATQSWLLRWLRDLSRRAPRSTSRPPSLPLPAAGETALTFVGHATVLVRYRQTRLISDPCFARSLYGLRRARPAALPDGALEGLDLVLITHAHADHLHRPSLERLDRGATVVVPAGVGAVDGIGFRRVVELEAGQSLRLAGVEVTAVEARHRVGWLGRGRALGYVVRGDGPTVYLAGDTGYFDGFAAVGAAHRPDVAVLPVAGYRPRALRRDHLSPLDALYAFEDLGAQLLVPVHHGSFALGYEPLGEPLAWLRSLAGARHLEEHIAWLEPGDSCVTRRRDEPARPAAALQRGGQTDITGT